MAKTPKAEKPKKRAPRKRVLRPSIYDPGVLDLLCLRLSGGMPIYKICRLKDMPVVASVYSEMAKNEDVRKNIARAREAQQDALTEETLKIADAATPETANVAKLRIWARQWYASKIAPKKYGDKQDVRLSGELTLGDLVKASFKPHEPPE